MSICKIVTGLSFLMLAQVALAEGIAQDVDTLESKVSALQTENAELRALLEELVALQRCHAIGGSMGRTISESGNHGVDWRGCDKRRIELRGPSWGGSELYALLFNADLRGTDFSGAYILGVAMNGSNLEGANFTNANLTDSNLTGASIVTWQHAQDYAHLGFQETIFDNTVCPDGTNSNDNEGTCANNRTPL